MMKILILGANPRKDLNLEQEAENVRRIVEETRQPNLEVEVNLKVSADDLQSLLIKVEPQVVHFCGHGMGEQGLVLQGDDGRDKLVSTNALEGLFECFSEQVECVFLNACYSEKQADVIVEHINYVIGMHQEIRDDAAIAFTTGFYLALGAEKSIEEAYNLGCNAIQLKINEGLKKPRKLEPIDEPQRDKDQPIHIPESSKPILKTKTSLEGEDPGSDRDLDILNPLIINQDLRKFVEPYREEVRKALDDRKLTKQKKESLALLRTQEQISKEVAVKVFEEEKGKKNKAQADKFRTLCTWIKHFTILLSMASVFLSYSQLYLSDRFTTKCYVIYGFPIELLRGFIIIFIGEYLIRKVFLRGSLEIIGFLIVEQEFKIKNKICLIRLSAILFGIFLTLLVVMYLYNQGPKDFAKEYHFCKNHECFITYKLSYILYIPYALINVVVVGVSILTVGIYTVGKDLSLIEEKKDNYKHNLRILIGKNPKFSKNEYKISHTTDRITEQFTKFRKFCYNKIMLYVEVFLPFSVFAGFELSLGRLPLTSTGRSATCMLIFTFIVFLFILRGIFIYEEVVAKTTYELKQIHPKRSEEFLRNNNVIQFILNDVIFSRIAIIGTSVFVLIISLLLYLAIESYNIREMWCNL